MKPDRRVGVGPTAFHRGDQVTICLGTPRLAVGVADLERVIDDDGALPPFRHMTGAKAGDLAAERHRVDAAGLATIDLDVPALLTFRVRGDLQGPQLLELIRLDQLLGGLRVQKRQVIGIADVQKAGARVQRQAPGHQVDGDQLGLRRARRHVDDQVLDAAVDDVLHLLRDQLVMPVDPELDGLAVLEEVPAEKQVILFA